MKFSTAAIISSSVALAAAGSNSTNITTVTIPCEITTTIGNITTTISTVTVTTCPVVSGTAACPKKNETVKPTGVPTTTVVQGGAMGSFAGVSGVVAGAVAIFAYLL